MTELVEVENQLEKSALEPFVKIEQELNAIVDRHKDVVIDCTTKEGMIEAKKGLKELRDYRIGAEEKGKEKKSFFDAIGKKILAKQRDITGTLKSLEEKYSVKIKEEENRIEREKQEKIRLAEEIIAKQKAEEDRARKELEEKRLQAVKDEEARKRKEIEDEMEKQKAETERMKKEAEEAKRELEKAKREIEEEKRKIEEEKLAIQKAKNPSPLASIRPAKVVTPPMEEKEDDVFATNFLVSENRVVEAARFAEAIEALRNFLTEYHDMEELIDLNNHIRTIVGEYENA